MAEGIIVRDSFLDIETVMIWVPIKNIKDELVTPTSVKVTVYDPDNTVQVDDQDMTQYTDDPASPAYKFYYYAYHKGTGLDPMQHGRWKYIAKAVDGTGGEAITSAPPGYGSFKVR